MAKKQEYENDLGTELVEAINTIKSLANNPNLVTHIKDGYKLRAVLSNFLHYFSLWEENLRDED